MSQYPSTGDGGRDLLPSTYFQTPNVVIDQLMPFLSDPELRCLLYTVRRITGFIGKRQDRIAVRQLVEGIVTKDGRRLDYGAGVSETVASKAMQSLCSFGILKKTQEHDPTKSLPPEYEINWGEGLIDWPALEARMTKKRDALDAKNSKLRQVQALKAQMESHASMTAEGEGDPLPPSQLPTLPPSQGGYNNKVFNNSSKEESEDANASSGTPSRAPLEEQKPKAKSPETKGKGKKAKSGKPAVDLTAEEQLREQADKELAAAARRIVAAYASAVGYAINWGRETPAAKTLVAQRWTPEQVVSCYKRMKSEEFWRGKHLALVSVEKQIGAIHASGNLASGSAAEAITTSSTTVLGAASRTQRPDWAYRLPSSNDDVSGL